MALYFENLIVWQKSFLLAQKIHNIIKIFSKEEQFALTDQMRRSSLSIPSNIAEGSGRGGNSERNHFLHIAKGSAMELQTQILLAQSFGYINEEDKVERRGNRENVILCNMKVIIFSMTMLYYYKL